MVKKVLAITSNVYRNGDCFVGYGFTVFCIIKEESYYSRTKEAT